MGRLNDKVAIITGSTSGMGEATAREFVQEGARVVVTGRNKARGEAIVESLGRERAMFVRADVTVPDDISQLVEATVARFDRIDCLFNNAAAPTRDVPADEVEANELATDMMNVFGSVVLMTAQVAPVMKAGGGGSIINNGSTAAHRANSSPVIYSAMKAAVCHLTRCHAMELSPFGIRVNTISPGAVVTSIFAKQFGVPESDQASFDECLSDSLSKLLPAGRAGNGKDIAHAAVYFASDESSYVTGQDLVVDGGLTGGAAPDEKAAQGRLFQAAIKPLAISAAQAQSEVSQ